MRPADVSYKLTRDHGMGLIKDRLLQEEACEPDYVMK